MGYRQSSFDPNAYERQGPPLRPFNWVQWTGVAVMALGLMIELAYLASRLGWIPLHLKSAAPLPGFLVIGMVMINSRRQPYVDPAPELAAARKRWTLITVAICTAILGTALIIQFA